MTLKGPTTLIEATLAPLNLSFSFFFQKYFWNLFNTSFSLNLKKINTNFLRFIFIFPKTMLFTKRQIVFCVFLLFNYHLKMLVA